MTASDFRTGYTPAAWEKWDGYNPLGQAALTLFLFMSNFLVVTILITVLTNSFMAIAQNANDEHQFVFAVNTISMVKSDALFSYIAPTNIFAWLLTPIKSCLPFRQYVKLNRTIIKITHFPVLFGVCAFERIFLKRSIYELSDLVENRGREASQLHAFSTANQMDLISPQPPRARDRSVATPQDRALDAVFRRPLRHQESGLTRGTAHTSRQRPKSEHIDSWFSKMGSENPASPPAEQDRKIVDRLERPRSLRRKSIRRRERRNFTATSMSIMSDPEDFMSNTFERPPGIKEENEWLDTAVDGSFHQPGEEGDDELVTQDEHEIEEASRNGRMMAGPDTESLDYFARQPSTIQVKSQPTIALSKIPGDRIVSFTQEPSPSPAPGKTRRSHRRNLSTNTILYNPVAKTEGSSSGAHTVIKTRDNARPKSRLATPPSEKSDPPLPSPLRKAPKRLRPTMPNRKEFQSTPNLAGLPRMETSRQHANDRGASYHMDLISDLGDNKAVGGQFLGAVPASFATHMGFLAGGRPASDEGEDQRRMGKLMLARMNTLEEGFREVIREVKDWRKGGGSDGRTTPVFIPMTPGRRSEKDRERIGKAARALGRRRKEKEWVEDQESAEASEARRGSIGGQRGSSI